MVCDLFLSGCLLALRKTLLRLAAALALIARALEAGLFFRVAFVAARGLGRGFAGSQNGHETEGEEGSEYEAHDGSL